MDHLPVSIALAGHRIAASGGHDALLTKLHLSLETTSHGSVFAAQAAPEIHAWAAAGKLVLDQRRFARGDAVIKTQRIEELA